MFQELFGNQKNRKITEHLLTLILKREIKNIDLDVNKRMLGNRDTSKIGRLDIRAKFEDGEDCNIELQIKPYEEIGKRLLDYWADMYTSKISRGNKYKILKPSIIILIANYRLKELEEIKKYHTKWNLREEEYSTIILTKDIEMHILEIPKVREEGTDELGLWLKFIENVKNEGVKKKMEEGRNKYYEQAMEELGYLSGDPDFKYIIKSREMFLRDQDVYKDMAREEGMEKGIKKGKKEGISQGKKEKTIEIAKKLLMKNIDIKDIEEITGLTKEEIEKLRQDN